MSFAAVFKMLRGTSLSGKIKIHIDKRLKISSTIFRLSDVVKKSLIKSRCAFVLFLSFLYTSVIHFSTILSSPSIKYIRC